MPADLGLHESVYLVSVPAAEGGSLTAEPGIDPSPVVTRPQELVLRQRISARAYEKVSAATAPSA